MKYLVWALIILLLAFPAFALTLWYYQDIGVTGTNTVITFTDNLNGGTGSAFAARHVSITSLSTSANTCYLNPRSSVATTNSIPLAPGDPILLDWDPNPSSDRGSADGWSSMGAICASGQTATFRVLASR